MDIWYESAGATFDPDRVYRYTLHRMWGAATLTPWRTVLWIMLNPSTADETKLDPTLRKCQKFSMIWGYDGFEVCNIFALRSTDPRLLYRHADPVGPENDDAIREAADRANLIVCGWGNHGSLRGRGDEVCGLLSRHGNMLRCLGKNDGGQPTHPLYIPYTRPLEVL
jgi:hypothetical protein